MAVYCPRCGSFNPGSGQACITCMGPLVKGQSSPEDARCATHPQEEPIGRCMTCGKAVCYECGSLVDGQTLCMTCATAAATTMASSAAAPAAGKKKGGLTLGKKK